MKSSTSVFLESIDNEIQSKHGINRKQVQESLPFAQWNSLKRLIQSMLREEMMNFDKEGLEHKQNAFIPLWNQKKLIQIQGVQKVSLSRYPDLQAISILNESEQETISNSDDFIQMITQSEKFNFDKQGVEQLKIEVNDSTKNDALTIAYRKNWNQEILQSAQKQNINELFQWAIKNQTDPSLFFEQWGSVGHPYHPGSKTKLGFSTKEVLSYSPEFQGGAKISLIAVHNDIMNSVSSYENVENNHWIKTQFPTWYNTWEMKLKEKGFNPKSYLALPIHPWQVQNSLKIHFKDFLESQQIILLDKCTIDSKATMSFRSVCPQENGLCTHLKLPVAIQATSAVRTVSPASIQIGPQVSRILQQIQESNVHIKENFMVIPEYFGMHFNAVNDDRQRHLSVLFRQNPSKLCQEREISIVVASLFVESPLSKTPLLCELIKTTGSTTHKEIQNYFYNYANIVINSFLRLYLKFGISLEAHQQNTLMLFKDGQPQKVMSRDFGGVRIHKPTLNQAGFDITPYPGAVTVRDDKNEVRNKMIYTTYQSHLGEIILLLSKTYKIEETILWAIVQEISKDCFQSMQSEMDIQTYEEEYTMIFSEQWNLKALTRMRLDETSHDYIYVPLSNPISDLVS